MIATLAGNNAESYSGDGGQSVFADLSNPHGIKLDSKDNIYIADTFNNRIRRIDKVTKVITTIAGFGSKGFNDNFNASRTRLNWPIGLAIDRYDNIIIADTDNHIIRNISLVSSSSSNGSNNRYIIKTIAGSAAKGYSGDGMLAIHASLSYPFSVEVDRRRNDVLIADTFNHRVRRVSSKTGVITTIAGGARRGFCGDGFEASLACLSSPVSIAISETYRALYIADYDNNAIRKVTYSFSDDANFIGIISSFVNEYGSYGYFGDGGLGSLAELRKPVSISIDPLKQTLYFADEYNHVIRGVSLETNVISTFVGDGKDGFNGDGGNCLAVSLNLPSGIAVDSFGDLFISDTSNHRIRKVQFIKEGNLFTNRHNNDNTAGGTLRLGLEYTQQKIFTSFVVVAIVGGTTIFSLVKFIKGLLLSTKCSNLDDTGRKNLSGLTNNPDNANPLLSPAIQAILESKSTTSSPITNTTSNIAASNKVAAAVAPKVRNNYTKVVKEPASGKSKSPSRSISGGRRRKTATSFTK